MNEYQELVQFLDWVAAVRVRRGLLRGTEEAMTSPERRLLRDYEAAYPHGRLGEQARALLSQPEGQDDAAGQASMPTGSEAMQSASSQRPMDESPAPAAPIHTKVVRHKDGTASLMPVTPAAPHFLSEWPDMPPPAAPAEAPTPRVGDEFCHGCGRHALGIEKCELSGCPWKLLSAALERERLANMRADQAEEAMVSMSERIVELAHVADRTAAQPATQRSKEKR